VRWYDSNLVRGGGERNKGADIAEDFFCVFGDKCLRPGKQRLRLVSSCVSGTMLRVSTKLQDGSRVGKQKADCI
jgi:hypothetical protein